MPTEIIIRIGGKSQARRAERIIEEIQCFDDYITWASYHKVNKRKILKEKDLLKESIEILEKMKKRKEKKNVRNV